MNYLEAYIDALQAEEEGREAAIEAETLDQITSIAEQLQEPYRQAIRDRMIAESLKCEINKGLNEGRPISEMLDKALKCISLMTGEELFYSSNKKKLLKLEGVKE